VVIGTFGRNSGGVIVVRVAGGDGREVTDSGRHRVGRRDRRTTRYLSVELPFEPVLGGRSLREVPQPSEDRSRSLGRRALSGKTLSDLGDDVGLVETRPARTSSTNSTGSAVRAVLAIARALQWLSALTGGFPDPYVFGRQVVDYFEEHQPHTTSSTTSRSVTASTRSRGGGHPVVATVHHPITVDRDAALGRRTTGPSGC